MVVSAELDRAASTAWRTIGLPNTGASSLLEPMREDSPAASTIAAIVLAAGLSSRMGSNKLLAPVLGKPMVRHAVEAALSSSAETTIVVTGHRADEVRRAVSPLTPLFVENHDYSKGLSASLKC